MGMGSVLPDLPPKPVMKYKAYLAERNAKIALGEDQGKFLDQTILTLGGGALGLTLTFLHDHSGTALWAPIVYVGIVFLITSVVGVLISLFASQRSVSEHIDALDDLCKKEFMVEPSKVLQFNPWTKVTLWINRIAGISVVVGIVCVSLFVGRNLNSPII